MCPTPRLTRFLNGNEGNITNHFLKWSLRGFCVTLDHRAAYEGLKTMT